MQIMKGIVLMNGVGYNSNIYLIDGELLVDAGTGSMFSEVKEEISNNGFTPDQIQAVVNTHCHYDHTGGDKKFRDWTGAKIAIHKKDARALESGEGTLAEMFDETAKTITVDKRLKGGNRIVTSNFDFEVIETPGHTPGSICLYEKEKKLLISGDTLFTSGMGRTDLPGGNEKNLFDSLYKLSKLDIDYLLPGHDMPKTSGVNFILKRFLHRKKKIDKQVV